jgi:hypothetical protein
MNARSRVFVTAAGWTTRRRVDITPARTALVADGHDPWPALETFLARFDGVRVTWIRNGRIDALWFDAARATAEIGAVNIRMAEDAIGCRLAPVGRVFSDHMTVLAAEDGRFFGDYDDVWLLGADLDSFFDGVLRDQTAQEPFWRAPRR